MSAGRLLSILLLLQARGRVTARALAGEFEVSARTIYRDIDQLSAAGVPVYAERGPAGGIALVDGYRTRLTGLTAAEAETLSIAGLKDVASELGLSDRLRDAQLKLAASLPQAGADTSRIGSRLHIDPVDWYQRPNSTAHLPDIATAVWEQKRIALHYTGWMARGERVVEPLGLVLKGGDWYLVARSKRQPRIYKVANVAGLKILDGSFERPPTFNLRQAWIESVERFEAGLLENRARLRATKNGMARLQVLGAAALARAEYGPVGKDGWQEVTLPVERLEYAAVQLFGLGAEVQVIEPVALRSMLRRMARAVLALYVRTEMK